MNLEDGNSILGSKFYDDSYHDGRIYVYGEYPAFLADFLTDVQIKVSKDQRSVWFLWPRKHMKIKTIFGDEKMPADTNDIHLLQATNTLKVALDQDKLKMDKLGDEVNLPLGYTGEPIFEFPYAVNRHFLDTNGKKTRKVHFSKTGAFRFWIQKTEARTCGSAAARAEEKSDIMEVDSNEVEILKEKLSKYEAEAQKWKGQAKKTGAYLVQLTAQVKELESRMVTIEKEKDGMQEDEIAALNDIIAQVKLQAKRWKGQAREAEEEIGQLKKQLKEVQEELVTTQKEKDEMEVDDEEVEVLNERIANITSQAQKWKDEATLMEKQLQDLNKVLASADDDLQTSVKKNEALKARHLLDLENLNMAKMELQQEIDEATQKITGLQLEIDMLRSGKEEDDSLMRELLNHKTKGEEDAAMKLKFLEEENCRVHTQLEQKQLELDKLSEACDEYFDGLKGQNEHLRVKFENVLKEKEELFHAKEEAVAVAETVLMKQKEEEDQLAKLGKRPRTDLLESEELRGALKQAPDEVQSVVRVPQKPLPEVVASNNNVAKSSP